MRDRDASRGSRRLATTTTDASVGALDAPARERALGWLLATCRGWLDPEQPAPTTPEGVTWDQVARFAFLQDLEPLLHHLALQPQLEGRVPEPQRARWEAAYYRNLLFNAELLTLGTQLVQEARAGGIELLVFKGPATIARGWGDPALRIMADVDLLCRREDLPQLARIARELDFQVDDQTAVHHLALRHRSLPAALELHFQPYEVIAGADAFEKHLWRSATEIEADGHRLPAPAPEAAVVLDLAHLLQHDLRLALRPFLDLAATLARQPELNLSELERLLLETDLAPEFGTVLGLLHHSLGLPLPAGLSVLAASPPEALAAEVVGRLRYPEQVDAIGPLEGPHRRGGLVATAAYVTRRLFPRLDQLKAMSGATSTGQAVLHWPAHAAATVRRAAARWRAGQRASVAEATGVSLKQGLFDRRGIR